MDFFTRCSREKHHKSTFLVKISVKKITIVENYLIDVFLVEEYEKYNIVPETAQSIHSWHFNDKSKDIINEGIQS